MLSPCVGVSFASDAGYRPVRNRLSGGAVTKPSRISREELAAEGATALPDKEVLSLLDLNANLDLAIDAAAPIDLAVAANANIAAPITAAAQANLLSPDAVGVAQTDQAA